MTCGSKFSSKLSTKGGKIGKARCKVTVRCFYCVNCGIKIHSGPCIAAKSRRSKQSLVSALTGTYYNNIRMLLHRICFCSLHVNIFYIFSLYVYCAFVWLWACCCCWTALHVTCCHIVLNPIFIFNNVIYFYSGHL